MRFLQTFWTGPNSVLKDDALNMRAGWLSPEYHWISWALSCLQAKSIFGEISLVTDKKGKEILIDQLRLPYSTVSMDLENRLDDYHPLLFALAKIFTYSIQTGPFLHLDSDVYFWRKPSANLLNSALIAQNIDKNLPFYYQTLNDINQHFNYIPAGFLRENYETKDLYASNAGIIGGNNPEFFEEYRRQAFEFIDKNKNDLGKFNAGRLNFIFEQYLFYLLADKHNIPVAYLKDPVEDPIFKDYIKFDDFPDVQMIHPVGGFKQFPHVCDHLAKKLREDYPEYYYRVIELVRGVNDKMRSAVYYQSFFTPGKLPLAPAAKTATLAATAPRFERTKAGIRYLNGKYALNVDIDLANLPENMFAEKLTGLVQNDREKECLLEIFHMELAVNSLTAKLYADTLSTERLYEKDIRCYHKIQDTFLLAEAALMKIKLKAAETFAFIEPGWDWKYDREEEIDALMQRNFNQEKDSFVVLLLPGVLQMNIREFYIDELDAVIFDLLQHTHPIGYILKEMEQYFSEDEIGEDYSSFKLLIIKTIKQLLYAGAIEIYL